MLHALQAVAFAAYYGVAAVLCGLVVWAMDMRPDGTNEAGAPNNRRQGLTSFLIGSAFAPLLIALLQGLFWLLVPRLPLPVYAILQWLAVLIPLTCLRHRLRDFVVAQYHQRSSLGPARAAMLAGILLAVGVVSCQAVYASLQPVCEYDWCTYALEGRRLAEQASWSGRLGLQPGPDNQFANHNHGVSYQLYLSASLVYGSDPHQDLPLRVAPRLLAVHCLAVLIGLGLRLNLFCALAAAAAMVSYVHYSSLMSMASRDFYRILPLLIILGLVPEDGHWPGLNRRGLLLCAAFAFLWNSHASSLMIAPTLWGCLLLFCPGWRQRVILAGLFVVALLVGGHHLVATTLRTGSPTADSPLCNPNYEGTAVVKPWLEARQTLPSGLASGGIKLRNQLSVDKSVAFELFAALIICLGWLALQTLRRRATPQLPVLIRIAIVYLLLTEALLAGLLDSIHDKISVALSMNLRYRAHVYFLSGLLISYILFQMLRYVRSLTLRRSLGAIAVLALVGGGLGAFAQQWQRLWHFSGFLDVHRANDYLANRFGFTRWLHYVRAMGKDDVLLMDYAYIGWYITDRRIIFTGDPRLRQAFLASSPEEALGQLDGLGVTYLYLIDLERKAIFASGIPLAAAIQSPAFALLDSEEGCWYLYRRTTKERSPDASLMTRERPITSRAWRPPS